MYTTCIPAYRSRSSQPVSAGWDPWHERASDVLAEQFFGPASLATVCPEAALMCAVLEDALLCYQQRFATEVRCVEQAREAEEWFFCDEPHGLFSFVSICTMLGLDPEFIRQGLKRWSQSRLDTP